MEGRREGCLRGGEAQAIAARTSQAAFAVNLPDGRVRQRPVLQVGDDLLDDGVRPVSGLGLQHRRRAVGEHRVVPVGGEQLTLLASPSLVRGVGLSRRTRRTMSRAVTCSASGRPVNAVNGTSATSASETHRPSAWSQTACGYRIGVHPVSGMRPIAATTCGVIRAVTENRAPPRRTAAITAWP
jgi:hypothetical protein